MENNNGRGIFYGVIGVATLIVAIIGATFAFFSASATVNNVAVGSAEITLEWGEEVTDEHDALIPVDTDDLVGDGDTVENEDIFAKYIGYGGNYCKDNLGNEICKVYQFEIKNPSPSSQTVYGHISKITNTFTNLYYAVFVGDIATLRSKNLFTVHGSADTVENILDGTDKVGLIQSATNTSTLLSYPTENQNLRDNWTKLNNATVLLGPGQSMKYTIVLWVEETYSDQTADEGKEFTASIMFNTGDTSGVTGQISTAGPAAVSS